jgi:hypothetical protein
VSIQFTPRSSARRIARIESPSSCGPHQTGQSRPDPIGAVPIPTREISSSLAPRRRRSISKRLLTFGGATFVALREGRTLELVRRRVVDFEQVRQRLGGRCFICELPATLQARW